MKLAPKILCLILLLSAGEAVFSEPTPQEEPPQYDVEIIVFTQNREGAGDTEYWPPISERPDWSQATRLDEDATAGTEMKKLPPASYRLNREYRRLKATGGRLRPVLHLAWRQPVRDRPHSTPVYIRSESNAREMTAGSGQPAPGLEGTVLVSSNRYLHVNLDLMLRKLLPPDLTSDAQTRDGDPKRLRPQYQTYRMLDHRRMRSGVLHYIDHPLFGVLILATPYVNPKPPVTPKRVERETQHAAIPTGSGTALEAGQPQAVPKKPLAPLQTQ